MKGRNIMRNKVSWLGKVSSCESRMTASCCSSFSFGGAGDVTKRLSPDSRAIATEDRVLSRPDGTKLNDSMSPANRSPGKLMILAKQLSASDFGYYSGDWFESIELAAFASSETIFLADGTLTRGDYRPLSDISNARECRASA